VSVVWECELVEGAVQRARSLVSPHGVTPTVTALDAIESAAESTITTRHTSGDMSGALIAQHERFADRSAVMLRAAGLTDSALQAHLATAATNVRTGVQHLDAIAIRTRAISQAATTATVPAAQRIIMTALRSQLAQAAEAVDSVRRDGAALSEHTRSLHYEVPATPLLREPQFPAGPIVWCLRPKGTFGFYRCSILYPDLSVGTYWSPTDDTVGS
jgi:hypothetical protein